MSTEEDSDESEDEELGMFDLNELLNSSTAIEKLCNICQSDKPCTCVRDLVMD